MTSDIDIYRSANELIKQYGDAADIEAAMRTDERLAAGDMDGEAVWLRIVKAVEELLSEERPDDAEVHYHHPSPGLPRAVTAVACAGDAPRANPHRSPRP